MKLINGFLKIVGFNAFMAFAMLVLLEYEAASVIFLVITVCSFAALLFLQLYKMYLLNDIKKSKSKINQ